MQGFSGGRKAAVAVNGIDYLQQVEGDFHVNKIEQYDLYYSLVWLERQDYHAD